MRNLEENMVYAIRSGEGFTQGNTAVLWNETGKAFYVAVHGNTIARGEESMNGYGFRITAINLCGWNTSITRNRLRALGVPVTTKNGIPYLVGKDGKLEELPEDGWTELFG